MCGSMADIQSAAAEIRQGKKEEERKKNKRQDENIMVCPIPQGDHNNTICYVDIRDGHGQCVTARWSTAAVTEASSSSSSLY